MIGRQLASIFLTAALLRAQAPSPATSPIAPSPIAPVRPSMNVVLRPYFPAHVPEVRSGSNSARLKSLIRGGALYLTAQDAVALAIENNIDLEVARYNPLISDWRLERAQAGGALPGVPSAASQAGTVASGQGVAGSQSAAGVAGGANGGGNSGGGSNATVSQIGPVTQTLDPIIQQSNTFSHVTTPQANSTQSLTSVLLQNTRVESTSIQQGFLSGGQVTLKFSNNYLNENSPTDVLNPSSAPNLSISFQHALLRGFGVAVNARNITVNRLNRKIADISFRNTVTNLVWQVLDNYYQLAANHEDLKSKQVAVETAETLLRTVRRQVDLGSVAPPELVTSENLVVTAKQNLVNTKATVDQLEVTLKNLLSRTGPADPVIAAVRIVPVDALRMPSDDALPELSEMVKEAIRNRADLAVDRANLETSRISSLGTANGVLPNVQAFGGESQAGLAGTPRVLGRNGADSYFVGGIGTALGQVFRRNFPTERIGVFGQVPIGNGQALADQTIDQLTLRQSELASKKRESQVEVDVQNQWIALRQARASHAAAVKNRQLQEALLAAEQKKYELGASIPSNIVQIQRDLAAAQSSELAALATYTRARNGLDKTLGRTLEANHITLDEALSGQLAAK